MVDVDRHMGGLTPAHAAGLRRLSARASAAVSHHGGLLSFRPLVESVLARLRAASVPIRPGLSDAEVSRLEADLAVSFPPDLRAILVLGLPSAPGFPDWRPHLLLRASLDLPLAAAALQVARGALALGVARAALRRSPFLIPVFDRCYIPSRPCLAGNPIFYVDEHRVFCCGFDLADFFQREPAFPPASRRGPHPISSSDPPLPPPPPPPARRSLDAVAGRTPRWIEFWSDAASDRRRRNSSSSSSSSSSGSASPRRRLPSWVDRYLDQIGSVLRSSGWGESDVIEIIGVPPSRFFDGDVEPSTAAAIDSDAALDALLVNADRCSQSLLRAGWSPDEVSDALGFDFLRRGGRRERPPMELPPEIAAKVEKLAEAVPTS
ncbi:hypothetical protein MUK42_07112 [Musa troglodytarum]|uniref:Uncharacterized protein n=1 Tax=Musa troglodytarum TaxID=320322 RepID=A0A9E7HSJ4_9LILI|nr:hypothetical protein MUK42_07112 [Musa troglodytarum]